MIQHRAWDTETCIATQIFGKFMNQRKSDHYVGTHSGHVGRMGSAILCIVIAGTALSTDLTIPVPFGLSLSKLTRPNGQPVQLIWDGKNRGSSIAIRMSDQYEKRVKELPIRLADKWKLKALPKVQTRVKNGRKYEYCEVVTSSTHILTGYMKFASVVAFVELSAKISEKSKLDSKTVFAIVDSIKYK